MARLIWDDPSERYYETGISRGVLFVKNSDGTYNGGVAWNGLISVSEQHTDEGSFSAYVDGGQYVDIFGNEKIGLTIKTYAYPDEFEKCTWFKEVSQTPVFLGGQEQSLFTLCYRTNVGDGNGKSNERLYILYECVVESYDREFNTLSSNPDLVIYSFNVKTHVLPCTNYQPTSILILDSRQGRLPNVEAFLYGSDVRESTWLSPDDIIEASGTHYLVDEGEFRITFGGHRILV